MKGDKMKERNLVVDFDVPQDEMQLVFDVTRFLESNKNEIIDDLKPFISRFLEDENVFNGPFSLAFDERFEENIKNELRNILLDNFEIDTEQAISLVDMMELVGVLELYLDKDLYVE